MLYPERSFIAEHPTQLSMCTACRSQTDWSAFEALLTKLEFANLPLASQKRGLSFLTKPEVFIVNKWRCCNRRN